MGMGGTVSMKKNRVRRVGENQHAHAGHIEPGID